MSGALAQVFGKATVTVHCDIVKNGRVVGHAHGTNELSTREVIRLKLWGLKNLARDVWYSLLHGQVLGLAQVLTQSGCNFWADIIGNGSAAGTQYIGMGSSTTGALKADTALGTATTEARVAASRSATTDTITWTGTVTADGAKAFKEVGLWNTAGSGSPPTSGATTLLIHANITTATMDAAGDQVVNTITLQVA